jgi:hypothetical protein
VNLIVRCHQRRCTVGKDVDAVWELIEVMVADAWMAVVEHPVAIMPGDQTHS